MFHLWKEYRFWNCWWVLAIQFRSNLLIWNVQIFITFIYFCLIYQLYGKVGYRLLLWQWICLFLPAVQSSENVECLSILICLKIYVVWYEYSHTNLPSTFLPILFFSNSQYPDVLNVSFISNTYSSWIFCNPVLWFKSICLLTIPFHSFIFVS